MSAKSVSQGAAYLSLLQRMTEVSSTFCIWKNADRALNGQGDADSAAPEGEWDRLIPEFRNWASDHNLGPVAVCRHVPTVFFLIAVDPDRKTFFELDVLGRKYWRGWTLFRAEQLRPPLTQMDNRGFREVRPGVEGVIVFTQLGTGMAGRNNLGGDKTDQALELMREDPEGVRLAARALFGISAKPLLKGIDAALQGGWDRRAMLTAEALCATRAPLEPRLLWHRLLVRRRKDHCPVLHAVFFDDRKLPDDVDGWVARIATDHTVFASS